MAYESYMGSIFLFCRNNCISYSREPMSIKLRTEGRNEGRREGLYQE